ncbi:hypothetical protein H0H93_011867, partial [Arthromyces matolae]
MGQHFRLFNLDSPLNLKNSDKEFGEFFFSKFENGDVDSLLEALWNPGKGKKAVEVLSAAEVEDIKLPTPDLTPPPSPPSAEQNMSKGLICRLPTELLLKVLEEVQEGSDLVNTMTTCQRLWDIGRPVLAEFIENLLMILWTGDRLVVLGNSAKLMDLPAGMLEQSEMKWIEDSNIRPEDHLWEIIRKLQVRNQHRNFDPETTISRPWHQWKLRHLLETLPQFVRFKNQEVSKDFFSGRAVFRNLKTREYIIWTTVMNSELQGSKFRLEDLSFEDVLYTRIAIWSSNPSMAIADSTAGYRGVWAGHPLDVSCIESVQDENGASIDGWKDLFNLDSPIKVKNSVGGKFGEFFFYSGHGDVSLLEALWDPAEGGKGVEVISTAEVDDGEDFILPTPADYDSSKGLIGQLSTELISMILEEVEDLVDLVALMMTCQRLWNIGRPVLEKFIQNMFVISWAGDRLVVFGDYANLADLPAGMLNKSEMKWIEDTEMSDDDLWEIIKVLQ